MSKPGCVFCENKYKWSDLWLVPSALLRLRTRVAHNILFPGSPPGWADSNWHVPCFVVKGCPTPEAATPVCQPLPPETASWAYGADYDLAELWSSPSSQKTASAPSSTLRLFKCLLFTTLKGFVLPKGHEQSTSEKEHFKSSWICNKMQITPTVTPWELTKCIISNLTDLLVVIQKNPMNF